MIKKIGCVLVVALILSVIGCNSCGKQPPIDPSGVPDLTVENLTVVWEEDEKMATATISNIGDGDAGAFVVYFNGEEDPVSPNKRPQVSHNIEELAAGDSIELTADFLPLADPANENLANVNKIAVEVDPKGMVEESDEENNYEVHILPESAGP